MGRKYGPLLLLVGAAGLWASSRMTWVRAVVEDDKSGTATVGIVGAQWHLELTGVALLLLAAAVAGVALRRGARRVVGVVAAAASGAVAWRPVSALVYGIDTSRVQQLLQAGSNNATDNSAASISQWALVTEASLVPAAAIVAIVAAAAALFGSVLLLRSPGVDGVRSTAYETKAARREKLAEELADSPDTGRVLWDALDDDIDPTDVERPR